MYKKYNVEDNIAGIQNVLINESIRETSNIQLLKSEEAIRDVLESYTEKFNTTGGKLTDMTKHYVEAKAIINVDSFNDLFSSLYIDLKTLYEELGYVDNILTLNLGRNKKFFSVLKKRMRELWNKLYMTRINITDTSLFDESYFEGFSTLSSQHTYFNLIVDKKTGIAKLNPRVKNIHNKSYLIKNIISKTFPVHNERGGVLNTSSNLNNYEENYSKDGPRDMLENGLWKEQLLCNDVPEINYDISEGSGIYKRVNGTLSIIDIEYVYPVEINNLDLDLFGEYPTSLIGLFTKNHAEDNWTSVAKLTSLLYSENYYDWIDDFKPVSAFDVLSLTNLELVKTKFLRLVLNQQNYEILESSEITSTALSDKINDDLSEKRYEVVKLDGGSDDLPAIPRSSSYDSLYTKVMSVIENTRSLEHTLKEILDILEPPPKLKTVDFEKTLKFETGLWSLEPTSKKYQGVGKFDSGDYRLNDKSLITVSLNTKQEAIKHNTCNWYISHPEYALNVPILENKSRIRKEPAHFIQPQYYKDLGWPGYFLHFDFPIDMRAFEYSKLYRDGKLIDFSNFAFYIMNTTLIYIDEVRDPLKNNYVVQYIPAQYDSVNVYYMDKTKDYGVQSILEYEVVAPRRSLIEYFININDKQDIYNVKKSRCSNIEFSTYFINNTNLCLSIDANNEMSESTLFSKNVVPRFRSVPYIDYQNNQITNILDGIIPSAIPIRVERNI